MIASDRRRSRIRASTAPLSFSFFGARPSSSLNFRESCFGQSSCCVLVNPRALSWPILVLHFGCSRLSWLSEAKSFVSGYKSRKKDQKLSGYESIYNLYTTQRRQSTILRCYDATMLFATTMLRYYVLRDCIAQIPQSAFTRGPRDLARLQGRPWVKRWR